MTDKKMTAGDGEENGPSLDGRETKRVKERDKPKVDAKFVERLETLINESGLRTKTAFAEAAGIPDSTLRSYLKGGRDPSRLNLIALTEVAPRQRSVEWLATGCEPLMTHHQPSSISTQELLALPQDPTHRGDDEHPLAFHPDFLNRTSPEINDPSRMRLYTVPDDNMAPTIRNGDILLIELRPERLETGRIYLFSSRAEDEGDAKEKVRLRRVVISKDRSCCMLTTDGQPEKVQLFSMKGEERLITPLATVVWLGRSKL